MLRAILSVPASERIEVLHKLGYRATNYYSDRVVRLERADGVSVFVDDNGRVSPPATNATMVADMELREAGIDCR